jgi:hypothetical protein
MSAKAETIEHWERMWRDPVGCMERCEGPYAQSCPFCQKYPGCEGCPVGSDSCKDTPFYSAREAWRRLLQGGWLPHEWLNCLHEWRVAARREIEFLEILPEEEVR